MNKKRSEDTPGGAAASGIRRRQFLAATATFPLENRQNPLTMLE